MPPKKNLSKTEDKVNSPAEASNKVTKKAANKSIEESTRTLRVRKTLPVEQPKHTAVKTTKKNTSTDTNNKNGAPAKAKQGRKRNNPEKAGKKNEDEFELEANGSNTTEPPAKAKQGRKRKNAEKADKIEPTVKLSKNEEEPELESNDESVNATSIYNFTAKDINGVLVSLEKYKGHVCIIVNVASRCGHTAQNYKEFVEIYDKYSKDKGLKILAFPCNQFGKQEPGDNEKICEFMKKKNVKFDMFDKIEVNGKNAHPLWKYLTSQKQGPKGNKIDWNFTKFLVNKDGQIVERFKPSVKPSALVKELEKLW